jgi:GTP diphosphokinase / guanosine-3',5'-bis(diphosphate) 3'-diphosphatase
METKYKTTDLNKITDVIAFRIITVNTAECYNVLGMVHAYYTPMIKRIKDYISLPKSNGYKSLHTTVVGMFRFPIEVQIRTQEMDEVAEYGVAAHFVYSDNQRDNYISQSQADWIKKLQDVVATYQSIDDKE